VPKEKDLGYQRAKRIKEKGESADAPVMNAFQWAQAKVQLRCPTALAEVRRYEADSKFFRSLIVVLGGLIPILISKGLRGESVASILLITASFGRYAEQRWKAAQGAHEYVIDSFGTGDIGLS
jgi:hypothetical protein